MFYAFLLHLFPEKLLLFIYLCISHVMLFLRISHFFLTVGQSELKLKVEGIHHSRYYMIMLLVHQEIGNSFSCYTILEWFVFLF